VCPFVIVRTIESKIVDLTIDKIGIGVSLPTGARPPVCCLDYQCTT